MKSIVAVERWIDRVLAGESPFFSHEEWRTMTEDIKSKASLENFRRGQVHIPTRKYFKLGSDEPMKKSHYTEADCDGNSMRAQADFVLAALGADRMEQLVLEAMMEMAVGFGGGVYKDEDRKSGVPEPSIEETAEFGHSLMRTWIKAERGFSFDTKKWAEGMGWKKNLIYRLEAIISSLYVLLRLASYESFADAEKFQQGEYFQSNFLVRLKRGQIKALKDLGQTPPSHLESGEAIIRHITPNTLWMLWYELVID